MTVSALRLMLYDSLREPEVSAYHESKLRNHLLLDTEDDYVREAYMSQTCPRCRSRHSQRILRSFRYLDCGLEAHRDALGVSNMGARCAGYAVRPMVWPMLLRWDGCGWNRNNGMPTQERISVEARVPATFGRGERQKGRHQTADWAILHYCTAICARPSKAASALIVEGASG
jgi:hypothetical protein